MKLKIQKFEDLNVWQVSMDLVTEIYQEFKNCKDFGLKDQIQRSAVSIPSNIAEGFQRGYNKEFIRFLHISNGSASELRTQLIIAKRVGILDPQIGQKLIEKTKHISAMLHGLIMYRKKSML